MTVYTLQGEGGNYFNVFGTRILTLGNAFVNVSRDNLLTRDEMRKNAVLTFCRKIYGQMFREKIKFILNIGKPL